MTPTFACVGPDKAGSTWLHEALLAHPQVFVPPAKGLYFFDRYLSRGLDWYVEEFAAARPDQPARGEVCQDYLASPVAAARMHAAFPDLLIAVTLRDPAERAFSSYLHMLRSGWTPGTFLEALESQPMLLHNGRYATHLARFAALFGGDRLHVAVFDDLVADPQAFLTALTHRLGVAPLALSPEQLAPRLPAGRARSVWASRLASRTAAALRERDSGDLVGRVKRLPVVQGTLYREHRSDRPQLTGAERATVQQALGGEVAELDRAYGLGLAARWGWPA